MRPPWPSLALTVTLLGCAADPAAPPAAPSAPEPATSRAARDAERDYAQAVELVQRREVERYPEAQALLVAIPADHPLRPDADAYLEWIHADLLVREARAAFDAGRVADALDRLDAAIVVPVLGPEAKDSVRVRRQRWLGQTRACRDGLNALAVGDTTAARDAFALAQEGDSAALADLAQQHLAHLAEGAAITPAATTLADALLALPRDRVEPPTEPTPPWNEGAPQGDATEDWQEDWSDWSDDDDWGDAAPANAPEDTPSDRE